VNLEGAVTWAFEFEDQPYFAGFRAMASNGLTLPVFNVHRMMAKMTGERIEARSSGDRGVEEIIKAGVRDAPDVAALASLDATSRQLSVLVWHYHDDDVRGPDAAIELILSGLPRTASSGTSLRAAHYRVDRDHSNAYTLWQKLGSPTAPTRPQYTQMEEASQLALLTDAPTSIPAENGTATLKFALPRQAVSLLVVTW
jgi:xylan 1,4-beta-xylosidase